MVFKREVVFNISFNVFTETDDRFVASINKTLRVEKNYESRDEAYRIGGDLDDWADKVANFKSVKAAAMYVGGNIPDFRSPGTWISVSRIDALTYFADDIEYSVISSEEPSICPPRQVNFYRSLIIEIERENSIFNDREKEIEKLRRIKEKTSSDRRRIQNLIDENEMSIRRVNDYRAQMSVLKEKCPDIETLI